MKIALVIAIHTLVQFADGSTVEDVHTQTVRHYESMESCERAAKSVRDDMKKLNVRKAFQFNASIRRLDIQHHCVEEFEDV